MKSIVDMPSKHCYFHLDCRACLFSLPRDAGLMVTFFFNSIPENYNPNIALCAAHFTEHSFLNPRDFYVRQQPVSTFYSC